MRICSYGAGVQTFAMLIMAGRGELTYDAILFANVGEDSENPETLAHYREFQEPYAAQHGLNLIELHHPKETLLHQIERKLHAPPIPIRSSKPKSLGAPGARSCTADFKIALVNRWTKVKGATEEKPAIVALGISLDEDHRLDKAKPRKPWEIAEYPLIERAMTRNDCESIIRSEGLPVPPPSSCWFCPNYRPSRWQAMKNNRPDLFAQSAELEASINAARAERGRAPVYLTRFGKPLADAIGSQMMLDLPFEDFDHCLDQAGCAT